MSENSQGAGRKRWVCELSPHRVVIRTLDEGPAFPGTAGALWPSSWQESSGPTSSLSAASPTGSKRRAPASTSPPWLSWRPHGGGTRLGALTSAQTMTPFPLNAPSSPTPPPSLPAGKPISHSGRQNPAAPRIVLPSAPPLSLVLITLSRLTASRAAGQTPHSLSPPGPASQ